MIRQMQFFLLLDIWTVRSDCCPRQFGFKIRMLGSTPAVSVPPLCWRPARRTPGCSPAPTTARRPGGSSSPAETPPPGAPRLAPAAPGSDLALPPPPAMPQPTERQQINSDFNYSTRQKADDQLRMMLNTNNVDRMNSKKYDKIKKKKVRLKTFSKVANHKGNSTPMRWVENILTCQIPDSTFFQHRSSKLNQQQQQKRIQLCKSTLQWGGKAVCLAMFSQFCRNLGHTHIYR